MIKFLVSALLVTLSQVRSSVSSAPIQCVQSVSDSDTRRLSYLQQPSSVVQCQCHPSRKYYTGNLNFVKTALSQVDQSGSGSRERSNIDLVITGCDQLRLELNFHNVASHQPFNLRIYDSERVEINVVELALSQTERQTVVVKNVAKFHVEGRIQCRSCPNDKTGQLNIQVNFSKD